MLKGGEKLELFNDVNIVPSLGELRQAQPSRRGQRGVERHLIPALTKDEYPVCNQILVRTIADGNEYSIGR